MIHSSEFRRDSEQRFWLRGLRHQIVRITLSAVILTIMLGLLQTTGIFGEVKSASAATATATAAIRGTSNPFPRGQCTWWASQRYRQVHGYYVPWRTNSNAYQWKDRARQFGWQVSTKPRVGSIIVLQPRVQGAGWLGHVAYVEKVLSNGHVITSNMNWGRYYWKVVNVEFRPGPGVTFVYA